MSPGLKTASAAGAVIVTLGAPLTVMVIVRAAGLAAGVGDGRGDGVRARGSVLTLRLAPVPRAPSRFEVHAMAALRSPCSGSVAVPVKTTVSPGLEDGVGGRRRDRDARGAR